MLYISQKQDNNADLAYWLSNSSSLLIILQKSLKPPGSSGTTPMKRPQTQTSFLGRMVCRNSLSLYDILHFSSLKPLTAFLDGVCTVYYGMEYGHMAALVIIPFLGLIHWA
jgi:hypothetical protein